MSDLRVADRVSCLPSHIHDWIEDAAWDRPLLDRVARLVGGGRPRAYVDRARPTLVRPTRVATVSVVIPCYNYARFLPAAVSSALEQADSQIDVVIVNDASSDRSGAVADELAAGDSRVRVIHNLENLGHVRAFNRGLAQAGGEFVVRLDADDLLAPGCLSRALAVFEAHPEVGLVYGHPRHFTAETVPEARLGTIRWSIWDGKEWVRERCRRGVNCITTPEAVVRMSVAERVGPLNPALRYAQDMEFFLRIAALSNVARLDDVDQALHRDHDASMSVNAGSGVVTDLVERRQVFIEVFRATGGEFPDLEHLDREWREVLASEALEHAVHAWDRGRCDEEFIDELRAFAFATSADGDVAAGWHRFDQRRRSGRESWLAGTVRAVQHRLKYESFYLRWARTGL